MPFARLTQLLSSWSDAQHPATLLSVDATAGYTPAGALAKMTYGNGLVELSYYNSRLQPMQLRTYNPATSTDVLNLSYGFTNSAGANNGNVVTFTSVATQIFMRSYTYDELNRLSTLSSPADASGCTGLSWTYDAWGNRLSQTVTSGTCGSPSYTLSAANRIIDTGFVHDAAGNMTHDVTHAYTFDAENHIATVDGTGATYVYDASGQRVRKTTGGVTTDYVYDASGSVVAEIQGTTWTKGYAYAGGKMVAQYNGALNASGATTLFAHADHLGSTRVMTTVAAGVSDSMDYLPYGELLGSGSSTTHKFTSKERDSETGLDDFDARYYSSNLGRFTSPDPVTVSARRIINPQIWNTYSYVGNNPMNATDPLGEELVQLGQHSDDEIKKRKKQIGLDLKNKHLSKEDRAKLSAERNTLDLEKRGNEIARAYLAALDKVGQRNGLSLSDLTLTTDVRKDFADDPRMTPEKMDRTAAPNAQAFNLEYGGPIYLKAEGSLYQLGVGDTMTEDIGGSILAHEKVHRDNKGAAASEQAAFTRQRAVFQLFRDDFRDNMDRFNDIDKQLQKGATGGYGDH